GGWCRAWCHLGISPRPGSSVTPEAAAIKDASRRASARWPAAILDSRRLQRLCVVRPGRRNGAQPNKETRDQDQTGPFLPTPNSDEPISKTLAVRVGNTGPCKESVKKQNSVI